MPQIIVTAGDSANVERAITLRERINASDFESERFATNLIERIAWAVSDAAAAEEQAPTPPGESVEPPESDPREMANREGAQGPRALVEV